MRLLILIGLLLLLIPVTAQDDTGDEDDPLLEMLARVPDLRSSYDEFMVSYLDLEALFRTRPGVEFADDPESAVWMATWSGIASGDPDLSRSLSTVLQGGPAMHDLVGFGFAEIEDVMVFGRPPAQLEIYAGDFDAQAIIDAHLERGYTQEDIGDLTLLCGPEGCDRGADSDITVAQPSNPFGGELGRDQPVLVGDGWVASSPAEDVVRAAADPNRTLADVSDYQAVNDALASLGEVVQTEFVPPLTIFIGGPPLPVEVMGAKPGRSERIDQFLDDYCADRPEMPIFTTLALAHVVGNDTEYGVVALVYLDEGDAQIAADNLSGRLDDMSFTQGRRPIREILGIPEFAAAGEPIIVASGDRYVTLLPVERDLPGPDPVDVGGRVAVVGSAIPYRQLVSMFAQRNLNWLCPTAICDMACEGR